jgi:Protein kinase domain
MDELLGRIIDRKYRLTRLLGEGGMGAVFEAEHTLIERKVAVKVMHPEILSIPEAVTRFFREAQASSAIGHPNIIEIQDVGKEEDGTVFIVMELLKGQSLKDLLEEKTVLSAGHAASIVLQVLSALGAAHEKDIIHRDMKPDNVFLAIDQRNRQEVKVLDFGIAKVHGALEGDQGLTKTGTVLGTPNYMAPEQARGKEIDKRLDIWAVGVMMYEMLSGQLPYNGESYNEIIGEILLETPPPLKEVASEVPDGVVSIVEKAMSKSLDERYSSVSEMIAELITFGGDVEGFMSNSVAAALKSSTVPPPYQGEGTEEPLVGLGLKKNDRRMEVSGGRRLGTLLKAVAALTGLLAVLLISTDQLSFFREQGIVLFEDSFLFWEEASEELTPISAHTAAKRLPQSPPPLGLIGDASMPASDFVPAEIDAGLIVDAGFDGSVLEDAGLLEITIDVQGMPRRAKLTLGGSEVAFPVTVPISSEAVLLMVKARGYLKYKQEIIPDKDQVIEIDMEKKGRRRSSRRKKSRRR